MAEPFQRVNPLILIADDDETERFLQRQVLESAGFDIVEAKSGTVALDRFAECKPDLVLLDVMMPEMNGFDVCRAIRTLPGGRNTPVLMATSLDDVDSIEEAYRTLAHNLRNVALDAGTILFTSPGAGEGKTASAVNLAVAYADSGRRAILVEADLRKPRAYQFIEADFTPGIAEVLRGDLDVREAVQRLRPRLSYIGPGLPAGRSDLLLLRGDLPRFFADVAAVPENPPTARQLRGPRGSTRAAEGTPPLVLVDAAPVLAAAEVSSLMAAVDAVVLVLRVGVSSRSAAARAAEQIRRAGGRLFGVILVGAHSPDELGVAPTVRSEASAGSTASGQGAYDDAAHRPS